MRKKLKTGLVLIFAAALIVLFLPHASLAADDNTSETPEPVTEEMIDEEMRRAGEKTDLSSWQSYFEVLRDLSKEAGDYSSVEDYVKSLAAFDKAPETMLERLLDFLLPGLSSAFSGLAGVIAAALLSGLAGVAFNADGTGKTVLLFLSASAMLSLSALFSSAAGETEALTADISAFCEAASPPLAALLTAMGYTGSAGLLAPKLTFIAQGIAGIERGVIIPMLTVSGVMIVLNGLSTGLKFERAVKLMHKSAKWLLGTVAIIYTSSAVIGGIGAGLSDSIAIRTARYAADKLVPAAGGLAAGAFDAVRAGTLLFKNAAGTASIILLAALIVKPIAHLACVMLALRAAAAVCEPFSDERIVKMLDGIADTVSLLMACAVSAAAMFTVTAVMIISTGGALFGA